MLIKPLLDRLEEAPGPLRLFYKKTGDGKFALDIEGEPPGFVPASKLDEFRENNRKLNAAVTELDAKLAAAETARIVALADAEKVKADLATFEGVDPAEYKNLKAKPDDTKRATELEAALTAERTAHAATQLKNVVAADFFRIGGRPGALDYIVGKAAETFTMHGGKVTTKAFSAKEPGVPLTVAEWMTSQLSAADFAFLPSKGGGATGGAGGAPPRRTIDASDAYAVGLNLEAIAKGEVDVR